MKILLILQSKNISGISYYRQLMPHAYLSSVYKDVEIEQIQGSTYENIFALPDEKLKEFQIAVLSREIDGKGTGLQTINRLRSLGIKVVLDIDDYWVLPSHHPLKKVYDYFLVPPDVARQAEVALAGGDDGFFRRTIRGVYPFRRSA